jgi:hypothetical protein
MMAGVSTTCEECEGKRFDASVLDYRFGGKDISEVLEMPVLEALEFFGAGEAHTPAAQKILERLADVGLGYLTIGQPLTTLSGGERQRLKLAAQMADKGSVYILDEPTSGLHLADVEQLLALLDRLVDGGKSVIVIEHHQAVMAHADWIIDLGPGAGPRRWSGRVRGHPCRLGRRPVDPHRPAPGRLRRRLRVGGPRAGWWSSTADPPAGPHWSACPVQRGTRIVLSETAAVEVLAYLVTAARTQLDEARSMRRCG